MQWRYPGSLTHKKYKFLQHSIFWDSHGVIMADYLEEGRRITGAYYTEDLRQLCQEIVTKRRGKLTRGVLLLQDNAPASPLKLLWLL